MKKKKKKTKLTAEFWARDAEIKRLVRQRIAYYERQAELARHKQS